MKRLVLMTVWLGASLCSADTITFTEVPLVNITPVTNQYSAFDIQGQDLYFYTDARDTFDGEGVSILSPGPGEILFTPNSVGSLSIDFWVIEGNRGTYSVFDSSDNLLDSFAVDASSGDALGSHDFSASDIARLELGGNPGFTQVSTLRFTQGPTSVPEPTAGLLVFSALGMTAIIYRRRIGAPAK